MKCLICFGSQAVLTLFENMLTNRHEKQFNGLCNFWLPVPLIQRCGTQRTRIEFGTATGSCCESVGRGNPAFGNAHQSLAGAACAFETRAHWILGNNRVVPIYMISWASSQVNLDRGCSKDDWIFYTYSYVCTNKIHK